MPIVIDRKTGEFERVELSKEEKQILWEEIFYAAAEKYPDMFLKAPCEREEVPCR